MRQTLRELAPLSHSACAALDLWLLGHPDLLTIAVYSALPGEVDLSASLRQRPGLKWVYPKIHGDHLTFHAVENPETGLVAGPFGIMEPAADAPEIAVAEIDAFICPGLAFDPSGGRLGRGRGFYDRILSRARPDALKIGICFEIQLVPDAFLEAHDIRMDEILS